MLIVDVWWKRWWRRKSHIVRAKETIEELFSFDVIDALTGLHLYSDAKMQTMNQFLLDVSRFLRRSEHRDEYVTNTYLDRYRVVVKQTTPTATVTQLRDIIEMDLDSNPYKKPFIRFVASYKPVVVG